MHKYFHTQKFPNLQYMKLIYIYTYIYSYVCTYVLLVLLASNCNISQAATCTYNPSKAMIFRPEIKLLANSYWRKNKLI